ncbi:MAG: hypothetical protein UT31_C0020G0006 [Parcubacteria group bacterium GW2011_GWF2_39_13b]|nr:MAG: hypothetical protein UT31_C0020G0006 [Parcubacteria group bacterium GW2011_GWF2_39_13b]
MPSFDLGNFLFFVVVENFFCHPEPFDLRFAIGFGQPRRV